MMSEYGRRLIVSTIDKRARETPDADYCQVPKGSDFKSGMRHITWSQFARAVDKASWWLEGQLGKSDGSFPTVAFIGLNSPLYFILSAAAIKTGYKILLISPRNSVETHLYLFDRTECETLLRGPRSNFTQGILAERDMRCITTPSLDDLLDPEGEVEHYPYTKSYEDGKNDPIMVLHSSGSTGPPKPIVIKNGALMSIDAHNLMPDESGYRDVCRAVEDSTAFIAMPCFHAAGVMSLFVFAVFFDIRPVYAPIGAPVTVGSVDQALDSVDVGWMFLPPSVCEDISREPKMLPKLEKLRNLTYAGGPLNKELGDVLHKHTHIVNLLGSTEVALLPCNFVPLEDWNYFLVPEWMKCIEMRPRADGLSEMCFVRNPSTASTDLFHSSFYTFPTADEYPTKDLFAPHPTKPHLWQLKARSDDVLVLSNGEKVVTVPMEADISTCPLVSGALVLGHARFETAALVEMNASGQNISNAEKLAAVTEYVDKANAAAPSHARISRDRILFTSADKPMIRAGKGTIIRKATLKMYEEEIEELFAGSSSVELSGLPLQLEGADVLATEEALQELFAHLAKQDFKKDQDFFAAGLDSLQVLNVVRSLKGRLGQETPHLSPDMVSLSLIYSNPTIEKLAAALHVAAKGQENGVSRVDEHRKTTQELYLKYSHDLPQQEALSAKPKDDNISVILTGSTGSLGSYLLDELLSNPSIAHIYCLNRSSDGLAKQTKASGSRGLSTSFTRATFIQTHPNSPRLGLSASLYTHLQTTVSYIIHNAWPVDFNLSLLSFSPHIAGVRTLIDLSAASPKRPPILFVSSIDAVRNWATEYSGPSTPTVPEEPIANPAVPSEAGYGASKHVAERLLVAASAVSGISTHIVRAGQLAGPVEKTSGGVWNKQEWFPTLVRSSQFLGVLPDSIGAMDAVDWVPVDLAARVVGELLVRDLGLDLDREIEIEGAQAQGAGGAEVTVSHLVNPQRGQWKSLLGAVQRHLDPQPRIVSMEAWVQAVRESAARADADASVNPAIKLVDFYEGVAAEVGGEGAGMAPLETVETVRRSATLGGMPGVTEGWMEMWMRQWGF